MFMRSATCKWVCIAAAHKMSPNMAFDRDTHKVARPPTLRYAANT
jgi:hypothetical protein